MKTTKELTNIDSINDVIKEVISLFGIDQGSIGIMVGGQGTVEGQEFCESLINIRDDIPTHQFIIVPTPDMKYFESVEPNYAALVRVVNRYRNDGIRYNQIYTSIYSEVYVPPKVRDAHDAFIEIIKHGYSSYHVSISSSNKTL